MELEELARKLEALGHPLRLSIIRVLAASEEMYLSQIAEQLGVSRALVKVHIKKLVKAGLVETRLVLDKERGKALRYYKLRRFKIEVSPEKLLGGEHE